MTDDEEKKDLTAKEYLESVSRRIKEGNLKITNTGPAPIVEGKFRI